MALTDLNDPIFAQPPRSASGRIFCPVRFSAAVLLILSSLTITAARSSAQDVAEAARQERARKQEQQKTAKHVYTNEDLKRQHILAPEDQAAVEARKNGCAQKNNCAPLQNPANALDANSQQPETSLGEVARQYRKQKELQVQKQKELDALKPKQSQPFHLSIGTPALASPILPERPSNRTATAPVIRPPANSPLISGSHTNALRRDPFAPVPARPRVPLDPASAVHPTVRPPARLSAPAAPKISLQPTGAGKLPAQPVQPERPAQPASAAKSVDAIAPGEKPHQFVPVHPLLPRKAHRVNSLPALASIFPPVRALVPFDSPSAQPAPPGASSAHTSSSPVSPTSSPAPAHSPSVAPPSVPVSAAKTIRVGQGDSLWKLAQRNLGYGSLWPMILAANPGLTDPNHLRLGTELALPAVVAIARSSPRPASAAVRTIKVHKGDTLWSLARNNLGQNSDWRCLAAANPALSDAGRIFVGQELVVPSVCGFALRSSNSLPHP